MSRIHDALRRAAQEKGKPRLPVEDPEEGKGAPKVSAPATGPPPKSEPTLPASSSSPRLAGKPATSGSAAALAAASAVASVAPPPAVKLAVVARPPGPLLLESCRRPLWLGDSPKLLFLGSAGHTLATEQLRNLRARLAEMRTRRTLRTIAISSPLPAEGKTFVAGNLAHALARQHDRRILLVDADLRGSTDNLVCAPGTGGLHSLLGAPGDPGLSEYLSGSATEEQILQRGPQENLFFIPAGHHAPDRTTLLCRGKLEHLLSRLSPLFDWILLDTPAVADSEEGKAAAPDARQIAGACDGVLLVIHAGATSRNAAQSAARAFPRDRLLGVVLNHPAMS